jgi:hypothetical protein
MSDTLCVGACMIDWDSGVCLGCGRTSEEIEGIPVAPVQNDGPVKVPLPANVAHLVGEGSE